MCQGCRLPSTGGSVRFSSSDRGSCIPAKGFRPRPPSSKPWDDLAQVAQGPSPRLLKGTGKTAQAVRPLNPPVIYARENTGSASTPLRSSSSAKLSRDWDLSTSLHASCVSYVPAILLTTASLLISAFPTSAASCEPLVLDSLSLSPHAAFTAFRSETASFSLVLCLLFAPASPVSIGTVIVLGPTVSAESMVLDRALFRTVTCVATPSLVFFAIHQVRRPSSGCSIRTRATTITATVAIAAQTVCCATCI
mmetsp:Transcript_27654/g.62679  ORF Transcript_27654/g.62679 Transcript_27654/m.62679 type:complete len:251 (+) Transcript_27654:434-1186(+)